MSDPDPIQESADGCLLHIYARPRASQTKSCGLHGARLKFQIAAAPVDGAANKELLEFLSTLFSIPKSQVILRRGETSKNKTVELVGVQAEKAREILLA